MAIFEFDCPKCGIIKLKIKGKPDPNIFCNNCNSNLKRRYTPFNIKENVTTEEQNSRKILEDFIKENKEKLEEFKQELGEIE